eukprot:Rmarinus@m.195
MAGTVETESHLALFSTTDTRPIEKAEAVWMRRASRIESVDIDDDQGIVRPTELSEPEIIEVEDDPDDPNGYNTSKQYRAFYCLESDHIIRRCFYRIVEHPKFDVLIMLCIVWNCVVLAMEDPVNESSSLNKQLEVFEYPFVAIFTLEFVLKCGAMGLVIHHGSYLRDPWNQLDFVVVVTSLIAFVDLGPNLSVLKTLRILRPLKTIRRFPEMRRLVATLLKSIPLLLNVVALMSFIFAVFGIIGVQLLAGSLRGNCYYENERYIDEEGSPIVCGAYKCPAMLSVNGTTVDGVCVTSPDHPNPNYGVTNYDTIGWALLTNFQAVTLEGWTDIMYFLQDGLTPYVWVYFISLILLGSMFVINLMLAVINSTFNSFVAAEEGKSQTASPSRTNVGGANGESVVRESDAQAPKEFGNGITPSEEEIKHLLRASDGPESGGGLLVGKAETIVENESGVNRIVIPGSSTVITPFDLTSPHAAKRQPAPLERAELDADTGGLRPTVLSGPILTPAARKLSSHTDAFLSGDTSVEDVDDLDHEPRTGAKDEGCEPGEAGLQGLGYGKLGPAVAAQERSGSIHANGTGHSHDGYVNGSAHVSTPAANGTANGTANGVHPTRARTGSDTPSSGAEESTDVRAGEYVGLLKHDLTNGSAEKNVPVVRERRKSVDEMGNVLAFGPDDLNPVRGWCLEVVTNKRFQNGIIGAICVNSITMAMTHHKEPKAVTDFLIISNFFFTAVFTLEMVLKVYGYGLAVYWRDGFNRFDAIIVLGSYADIVFASGGVSVLRTFRLLRAFKLVSNWENLRSLIDTVLQSFTSIVNFSGLLGLFLFIYALVGMSLYGGEFYVDGEVPRENFDDFLSSFTAIFQLLTGENWNEMMYLGIDCCMTLPAVVFYVSFFILGNYILLNLFLAILLSNFDTPVSIKPEKKETEDEAAKLAKEVAQMTALVENLDAKEAERIRYRSLPLREKARERCTWLVQHRNFELFIIFLIFLSSVALAMDDQTVVEGSFTADMLYVCDVFFTTAFAIEMVLKMFVCRGLPYFRDNWNRLDFFIVTVSVLSLSTTASFIKSIRVLRALRPLRFISRVPELRMVLSAILKTIPPLVNVLLLSALIWLIFGILGVELWKGKLYYCESDDPDIDARYEYDRDECEAAGFEWTRPIWGFDHIFEACLTLFEVATLEGWLAVMWACVDATEIDKAPQKNYARVYIFYFIIFIIFGSFFLLNLFVGVVIDTFTKLKKQYEGSAFLSEEQRKWVETQRMVLKQAPKRKLKPPRHPLRRFFFFMCIHRWFEWSILACIVLNTVSMALRHYDMSDSWEQFMTVSNIIFSSVFIFEAFVKLVAIYPTAYFADSWNCFDFVIVLGSLPGFFMASGNVSYLRIFRIARIFKIVKSAKSIRTLLRTLYVSLPTFLNVGSLLLLLFFIFAVLGMNLFGSIKRGESLNRHANFEVFWRAMMTLFRMATGESWNDLMADARITKECEGDTEEEIRALASDPSSGCCSSKYGIDNCGSDISATLYFVAFQVAGGFIMLNLFIAVILENFADFDSNDETENNIEEFKAAWQSIDIHATQSIGAVKLYDLLLRLGLPLGLPENANRQDFRDKLDSLKLETRDGRISFLDTLNALCEAQAGVELPDTDLKKDMEAKLVKKKAGKNSPMTANSVPIREFDAAVLLQTWWRRMMLRKYVERAKQQGYRPPPDDPWYLPLLNCLCRCWPQRKERHTRVLPEPPSATTATSPPDEQHVRPTARVQSPTKHGGDADGDGDGDGDGD